MELAKHRADVVVVGAGPGGYAAAFRAADLGLQVVMVDARGRPGGVCLHDGCIPSKTLLHVSDLLTRIREADRLGIEVGEPRVNPDRLRSWKRSVIDRLASGVAHLARQRGVRMIWGPARFLSSSRVAVSGEDSTEIDFSHAVLATGSRPVVLPGMPVENPRLLDSTTALDLETIPENLLVIGGGYIGLELGTVYAALGSRVTVVEMLDGLLPGVDRDLVRPLQKRIRSHFEAVHLRSRVGRVREIEDGLEVELELPGEKVFRRFDQVLVAVGRRPNSEGLGLENTGVTVDAQGFIGTDTQCRTGDPAIFAIGDVAGQPMLAHKATREAKVAAEVIAGEESSFEPEAIPAVVFTDPEVAWCGLTEGEAKATGQEVQVVRFPWAASGRAQTMGRPEGMTKIILEPDSGQVLGVGIVGAHAGELIAEGVAAIEMAALAEDLTLFIHAHPTLSETLGEAAEFFLGQPTHLFRPPRKRRS